MKKLKRALGLAADLAPGAAIAAIGVLCIAAGVVPGALWY